MKLMTLYARPDSVSTGDANSDRVAAAGEFLGAHVDPAPDRLVLDVATPLRGRELSYIGTDTIVGDDEVTGAWGRHVRTGRGGVCEATIEVGEHVLLGDDALFESGRRLSQSATTVKVVAFLVRRPELTTEQFARYWEDRHAPLAMEIVPEGCFGYAYVQNHALATSPRFDGVVEMYFRDHEHLGRWVRWFNGDDGARLRRDEYEFMLPDERVVLVTDERVLRA